MYLDKQQKRSCILNSGLSIRQPLSGYRHQLDLSGCGAIGAVTCDTQKIDLNRSAKLPDKIGKKNECPF
jgi:hypothetical protein